MLNNHGLCLLFYECIFYVHIKTKLHIIILCPTDWTGMKSALACSLHSILWCQDIFLTAGVAGHGPQSPF